MRRILLLAIVVFGYACEPRQGKKADEIPSKNMNPHEIVVQEVLQANSYTYVRAMEGTKEIWMAIPKKEVETGKTYYYDQAMEMKNFKSKDLDRTFESIYFLNGIFEDPNIFSPNDGIIPDDEFHRKKETAQKQDLNIQQEDGIISIGYLYDNREEFINKKIKVKGMVTKFNPDIMNKNWIHIQDGTGGEKSFDLTITTNDIVSVGAIATFEGTFSLNKDFGHGYTYEVILEEAVQLDKKNDIKVN